MYIQSHPLYKPQGLERIPMFNRNLLQIVQASLVSNGVHRRTIIEATQAVIDDSRDEAIRRATQRANDRADREKDNLTDSLEYEIAQRNRDHQRIVNSDERINTDNVLVPFADVINLDDDDSDYGQVQSDNDGFGYESNSGLIPSRYYPKYKPLYYNGIPFYGKEADGIVLRHNAQVNQVK